MWAAQQCAPKLKLPLLLLVLHGIKQRAIVCRPHDGAGPLHFTGQRFARLQVLDAQRVLAEALGVGGVGQPAAVVGNVGVADREKRMALGQLIAVQQHFFRRIGIRPRRRSALAAVDGVLQTLLGARVVPPVAVAVGNRNVGLLHVAQHLLVELFAQPGQRRHHRLGIGIFSFEIGGDIRVFFVAQPCVVVGEQHSVHLGFAVVFAGGWGRRKRILAHFYPSVEPAGGGTSRAPPAYN